MHEPPLIRPMELEPMALPREEVMPNSVPLYCIDGGDEEVVRFELLFKGGYGVQQKPLQATFTNRMLREGAGDMNAEEISRRLDYYGAWIETYSSQECNHVVLYTMSRHFVPLLELLEEIMKAPQFNQENLDTVRRNAKAYHAVNSRKVDVVSQRYFEKALWGDGHPLGHVVEESDYDSITVEDLRGYYDMVYGSRNCIAVLSGNVCEESIAAVRERFGSSCWGNGGGQVEALASPKSSAGRHTVRMDGTLQVAVKIGFMAMDATDSDLYAFRFLTVLLGGYFGSRLMSNVREENGYTYHISAEIDAYGNRNAFMISSETANEYVEACIKEIYKEIDRVVNEPIPEEEVELVRSYIMGEMCRECEGLSARSEIFVNALLSGAGFHSVNGYLDIVRSITPERLGQVARKYLRRENMIEIVAGAV